MYHIRKLPSILSYLFTHSPSAFHSRLLFPDPKVVDLLKLKLLTRTSYSLSLFRTTIMKQKASEG
jgi:hypothetical protein